MNGRYDRWDCAACGRPNPFYAAFCLGWRCHALRPEPPDAAPVTIAATHNGRPVVPRPATDLPRRTTPADPPLRLSAEERAASDRVLLMALGNGWEFEEARA